MEKLWNLIAQKNLNYFNIKIMAIRKTAKNITIKVTDIYNLTVGNKMVKIAEKINTEASKGNLVLASLKKIVSHGNK